MKKTLFVIFALMLLVVAVLILRGSEDSWICSGGEWVKHGVPSAPKPTKPCGDAAINSFKDCAAAGNPVMESYPRQCRSTEGKTFIENIGNELEKVDFIRINTPRPNQVINSPLVVGGEARGSWFFEGDFPVILTDWDGKIIAEGFATAKGEWMTEDFVVFEGILEFEKPNYGNNGTLILRKDNPSGLPEYDDALGIPVFFEVYTE